MKLSLFGDNTVKIDINKLPKKYQAMIEDFKYEGGLIDDCVGLVYFKEGVMLTGEEFQAFPIKNQTDLYEVMKGCHWQ